MLFKVKTNVNEFIKILNILYYRNMYFLFLYWEIVPGTMTKFFLFPFEPYAYRNSTLLKN